MSKFEKGDKIKNVTTNEIGYVIEVYLIQPYGGFT